jgi:hypothetical protein
MAVENSGKAKKGQALLFIFYVPEVDKQAYARKQPFRVKCRSLSVL